MSLIFNALQRFSRTGNDVTGRPEAKPAKRNAQSLRRCFLSPGALLTVAGAIVITGLLAVQLTQSLSANARTKESSGSPAAVPVESPPPVAVQTPVDAGPPISAPGSIPPVQTAGYSSPADGSSSVGSHPDDAGSSSQLVFYPPEPDIAAGEGPAQPARGRSSGNPAPAGPAGRKGRSKPEADPRIPGHMAALKTYSEDPLPERRFSGPAAVVSGMADGGTALQTTKRYTNQEPAEIAVIESEGSLSAAAYRRQAARAASNLNVTQLSQRIASAMQSRDQALVGRLMEELEKTQGSSSLFLIRLKAYWQIQQNNLEKARRLLEEVLAKKPDDKESGLNLAVVDMRAGRMEPARRRLERLQHLYPEDDEIAAALQQLHR